MSAMLADVKKNGIPEGNTDRGAFRHARDLQNTEATPYGAIVQFIVVIDKSDGEQRVPIANPMALLWKACADCVAFADFMRQKLTETPPTLEQPWSLVFYTDEVTPGNPLAVLNDV